MTSTIKVNTVTTESGSTLTLGGCGKTVALASGASQSGFGRTGTVDWQTGSIKTTTFTAANGEGYFADTSSGAITMNLPAGTAGNIVSVVDYTNTFNANNLTISPNGSQKIGGNNADVVLDTQGQSLTFVYVDDTEGWKNVQDSTSNATGNAYIQATGGTITCCGNYKIHTFTGPGTFTVSNLAVCSADNRVDYLVVAGGGSGGTANGGFGAGAGGAGGFRSSNDTCMPAPLTSPLANPTGVTVTATSFPITVGGGGAAFSSPNQSNGNAGSNSTFSTITSAGGGYGAGGATPNNSAGGSGGSGGGAWGCNPGCASGGTGNTPPVSPPQGNNGGSRATGQNGGAGGGGAGAAGGNTGSPSTGGTGGIGSFMVSAGFAGCNGTTGPVSNVRYFSGGGGGSASTGTPGGAGGGGKGGDGGTDPGGDGTANTGGGGGGSRAGTTGGGGSGIVIIRYKYQS